MQSGAQSSVNNDPWSALGQKIKDSISTPGGFLGAHSVASNVGNYLGWHPTRGNTKLAANYQPQQQSQDQGQQNSGPVDTSSAPVTNLSDIKGSNAASSAAAARDKQAAISAITGNWDDTSGSIKDVGKSLDSFKNTIGSSLGKARDAYLGAASTELDKKKAAIAGNRDLIMKNQKTDMGNLAEDIRKSIFNTNLGLGASAGSSASLAAEDAINKAAGKNRAQILTGYGDNISTENQNEQTAAETYATQRQQAYDWEERNKQQLMDEYNTEKAILEKLQSKVPDWKQKDIESLKSNNLDKLLSQLQNISNSAKGYRDTLSQMLTQQYGNADALNSAAVGITPPAALDTPTFDEHLSMPGADQTDPNATSFTNPNVTGKKRVGTDILGNPYYVDDTGNPVA